MLQLVADTSLFSFSGNSFNYSDLADRPEVKEFFKNIPETLSLQLMQIFTECEGQWLVSISGIKNRNRRSFPALSFAWKLKPNTKNAVGHRVVSFLRSLPGSRPVQYFHLNTGYFALQQSRPSIASNESMLFTPCVAVLEEHLICTLDEDEMKQMIGLIKGHEKPRAGTESFASLRTHLPGDLPLLWVSCNIKQVLDSLRSVMTAHAFNRPSFTRQEVNASFEPVLAAPLPFNTFNIWAGQISDNEAQIKVVFDNG